MEQVFIKPSICVQPPLFSAPYKATQGSVDAVLSQNDFQFNWGNRTNTEETTAKQPILKIVALVLNIVALCNVSFCLANTKCDGMLPLPQGAEFCGENKHKQVTNSII